MSAEERQIAKLKDALDEMKRLILDYQIPQGVVRRYVSFELAAFIYDNYDYPIG